MKWLRKLFDDQTQQSSETKPAKGLSAEQQQALCLSLQKLQYIALGAKQVTLPGESPKFEISQQTARWAIPYAERILDAHELFRRGDIRGALSIFLSLPEAAIIQMNIGVCYAELGEKQEAGSWLRKSVDTMPPSHQGMLEENFHRLRIDGFADAVGVSKKESTPQIKEASKETNMAQAPGKGLCRLCNSETKDGICERCATAISKLHRRHKGDPRPDDAVSYVLLISFDKLPTAKEINAFASQDDEVRSQTPEGTWQGAIIAPVYLGGGVPKSELETVTIVVNTFLTRVRMLLGTDIPAHQLDWEKVTCEGFEDMLVVKYWGSGENIGVRK